MPADWPCHAPSSAPVSAGAPAPVSAGARAPVLAAAARPSAALPLALVLLYYITFLPGHVYGGSNNATLPPEAQRTRALATAVASGVQLHVSELSGPTLHDLIVAVGYLLDKKTESR